MKLLGEFSIRTQSLRSAMNQFTAKWDAQILQLRYVSGLYNETLLLVSQAGCSSEPIPRTPSNFASASDSPLLFGLLVSGSKAVKRPRAGRNAQTL